MISTALMCPCFAIAILLRSGPTKAVIFLPSNVSLALRRDIANLTYPCDDDIAMCLLRQLMCLKVYKREGRVLIVFCVKYRAKVH